MAQVDVVIPVYNTPIGYVRQALSAVLGQTFPDWQAIVVNDGCRPDHGAQLEALVEALNDGRIRYLKTENRGVSQARNLAIRSSRSPFVALLDADDIWYADKLARQIEVMRSTPSAALVHTCSDRLVGDDLRDVRRIAPKEQGTNELPTREACVRMLLGNYVGTSTVLVRRAVLERVGLFDPALAGCEDKELWLRMLLAGERFVHLAEALAVYRVHASNSSKQAETMRDGRIKLVQRFDASIGRDVPWLSALWPAIRREMIRHAHREVAETHLEAGRFSQALQEAAPWRSGFSRDSIRLCAAAVLGLLRVRRQPAVHGS